MLKHVKNAVNVSDLSKLKMFFEFYFEKFTGLPFNE